MEQKILEQVYILTDEIKQSESYRRMVELKKEMQENPDLVEKINLFNKVKKKYEEVAKYGKYHPDLKKVQLELSKVKQHLFEDAIVQEYKMLEKEIQQTLNDISKGIATVISPKIKHPNEMGIMKKH